MVKIGVLALQGSVMEHINVLNKLQNVEPVEVRSISNIEEIDGLIIPGGESTTIGKLLNVFKLKEPLLKRINSGMPVWGTCAGLILMAKQIVGEDIVHLGVMDISVRRNAYGSQLNSFNNYIEVESVSSESIPGVFIRAPWVEETGEDVEILSIFKEQIVAVKQGALLGTSFHPELTDNIAFHEYFLNMIRIYIGCIK